MLGVGYVIGGIGVGDDGLMREGGGFGSGGCVVGRYGLGVMFGDLMVGD